MQSCVGHCGIVCCNLLSLQIYVELDIRYHPVEGAAGSWDGLDFLIDEDNNDDDA